MKRAIHETVQALVERLPEDLLEAWQERAAIREYDGGLSRPHAEALALLDLVESEPDAFSGLSVAQVQVAERRRHFVASSEQHDAVCRYLPMRQSLDWRASKRSRRPVRGGAIWRLNLSAPQIESRPH